MEVPIIPETGINDIILEQINDYVSTFIEQTIRYGNSIPMSTREKYFEKIVKDFQEWYKKYPEVHSIDCVKKALIFCPELEKEYKPCVVIDNN